MLAADAGLEAIVPTALWKDCRLQTVAEPAALQTAVCLPSGGMPDRWQISSYPDGAALDDAYEGALRSGPAIARNSGKCNAFSWGGERQWLHGPDKPGGRIFCYFDGNDAVAVWTHKRLGQPTHRDVLMIAREGGSDHAGLTRWWRPWHHLMGKAQSAGTERGKGRASCPSACLPPMRHGWSLSAVCDEVTRASRAGYPGRARNADLLRIQEREFEAALARRVPLMSGRTQRGFSRKSRLLQGNAWRESRSTSGRPRRGWLRPHPVDERLTSA